MRDPARRVLASICVALSVPAAADPARAGAWTREPGEGLLIFTAGQRIGPLAALTGGPAERDASITQIYLEYGLRDGLTVGAKAYVEFSRGNPDESSASLGAFVRKRLWQDGRGGVASVEAGFAHPIESLLGPGFDYADPGAVPEAHLAGLYGRGWAGDWGNAFLATGAAYQYRGKGLADEIRAEITAGFAPWERWMGMLSLYGLTPLGPGTDASLRLAPSVAYTMGVKEENGAGSREGPARPTTIQFGVSYDLLNPSDGIGLSLSIWRPF